MHKILVRLNDDVYSKLSLVADRYGMSKNALISYIIGQWLDNNFDLKDRVQKVVEDFLGRTINDDALEQALKSLIIADADKELK